MTDNVRGMRGPAGPPWSVDLLADLHAGVLDPELSSTLWPQVNADPEAREVLAALDSIKVELGQLGSAPAEPMPAQFAAQLDAAIEAEASRAAAPQLSPQQPAVAPVVDLAAARRRRNRRMGWAAGVLTAAAAAVAVAFIAVPDNTTGGAPVAAPPETGETNNNGDGAAEGPLALSQQDLNNPGKVLSGLEGESDYGPMGDEETLMGCLSANDVDAAPDDVAGAREVTFDGKPGVAVLLNANTGQIGQFRLVIVEPTCNADNPGTMMSNTLLPTA